MTYSTLYLILGFGYVMACNGYFHNVRHNLVDGLSGAYNRIIRSVQNNIGGDKYECAGKCAIGILTSMNSGSPDMKEAFDKMRKSEDMLMTLTKPQFQKFCKDIIKPALSCIDECPNTMMTKVVDKAFALLSFVCEKHYDEIYKNYGCLQKTHDESVETCIHGKCEQYSNATKALVVQTEDLLANKRSSEWKPLMSSYCQFSSCLLTCCSPIMEKNCGKSMTDLMGPKLNHYSLTNAKEWITLVGHPNDFPPECEKIVNETKGNRKEILSLVVA